MPWKNWQTRQTWTLLSNDMAMLDAAHEIVDESEDTYEAADALKELVSNDLYDVLDEIGHSFAGMVTSTFVQGCISETDWTELAEMLQEST